jgi:plasmid stabilization system protein ParE
MARARRTAAAERDFENIAYQIAVVSGRPATAERILCELQTRCDEISARTGFSIEGTAAPQIGDGVRLVSHQRWVILFRYDRDDIVVLRIADGSQDYLTWQLSIGDEG